MNIIKVIVDELPISCGECPYAMVEVWADDENGLVCFCSALSVLPDGVQDNALGDLVIADHSSPDWCPLEEKNVYAMNIIQEYVQNPFENRQESEE